MSSYASVPSPKEANRKVKTMYMDALTDLLNDNRIKSKDVVSLKERESGFQGGAKWDVVNTADVTVDGLRIVQSIAQPSLSVALRDMSNPDPRVWGAKFNNVDDVGAIINEMLSKGVAVEVPLSPAVVNTQINLLENSVIHFNASTLRTTNLIFNIFSAVSVDGWSMTGSLLLSGTALSGQSAQVGVLIKGCKRYKIENVFAALFKGWGFRIQTDGIIDNRAEHGQINNCAVYDSWVGWEFEGGTSAEYQVLSGCSAINNVTGVVNVAGNINWNGGNIVDNGVGLKLDGGSNDNHGIFSGVNINHNTTTINANDVGNGYTFDGCHFYGSAINGAINLTNCKQFNFNGGTLACTVNVNKGLATKNGQNVFKNMYLNVPAWNGFLGDDLGNVVSMGHYDDNGLNLDFIIVKKPIYITGGIGFLNAWVDYSLGRAPAGYRVDENGDLKLSGSIKSGAVGTIFILPVGYRTDFDRHFIADDGSASGVAKIMIVGGSGNVDFISGANTRVCLDGIVCPRIG